MKLCKAATLIITLALIAGSYSATGAAPALAGKTYYVSTTGKDTNSGTSTSPFKTFAKGISAMGAGDTLIILPGTYNQQLKISKSGTSSGWITVKGPGAVIDLRNATSPGIYITGSYVDVSGLEVENSTKYCVDLRGSHVTASGLTVHDCQGHGISSAGNNHVQILNNRIYRAVLSNSARALLSGWDSGIKVRVSDDVLIQGNTVFDNYGEGMATRGTNITIRGNTVYDNYSVNIYTNSENALIEKNFVYCTPNSGFERSGKPAAGIAMGEEYYEGWGARLINARVLNNIVAHCKNGVRYNGAETGVVGGGLKYATIAYNTLYDTVEATIGIVYASAQTGNLIADNIVWQADNRLVSASGSGLTFKYNLWKVQPPTIARGTGDKIGSPGFVVSTPKYAPGDYRIGSGSLARGNATNLSIFEDYFNLTRTSPYDIGAAKYGG
ncbi:MAG: right-handed parallel beta-helix repeat-containing protein [Bacteroidota bacterium]